MLRASSCTKEDEWGKKISTPFFKHLGMKEYTSKQSTGQSGSFENKKYIKTEIITENWRLNTEWKMML